MCNTCKKSNCNCGSNNHSNKRILATIAAGANPTKAEFDALLAELRAIKANIKTSGVLAT